MRAPMKKKFQSAVSSRASSRAEYRIRLPGRNAHRRMKPAAYYRSVKRSRCRAGPLRANSSRVSCRVMVFSRSRSALAPARPARQARRTIISASLPTANHAAVQNMHDISKRAAACGAEGQTPRASLCICCPARIDAKSDICLLAR